MFHDLVLAHWHLNRRPQGLGVHHPVQYDVFNYLLQAQILHGVSFLAQQLSPLGVFIYPPQSLIRISGIVE